MSALPPRPERRGSRLGDPGSRRVYAIWPADREGLPATTQGAWRQSRRWLVLDVTDGLDAARVVEGPVSRWTALHRELELRAVDQHVGLLAMKEG